MDDFKAQFVRLRCLLAAFLPPEFAAALMPLTRPALRLGTSGEVPVHLGGVPLLPPDEPWPCWKGRLLGFLGAIDFAALSRFKDIAGLPPSGKAAFYYACETPRPWGDEATQRDGWRVLTGDLREATPPPGASNSPQTLLHAAPFLSLPSPQEAPIRRLEATCSGFLAIYEQLHAVWAQHIWPDDMPVHQLGGWPALVQRPIGPDCLYASTGRPLETLNPPPLTPEEEQAVQEWQLLLQLDSDDRLGWYWGDPGRIYFSARPTDPPENSWLTLQAA
ncbi:YwqG family protein [Actinomadura meridiana]